MASKMSLQNKKIYFIVGHGRLSTCEDDVSSFEEFKDEMGGITTCVPTRVPNNNNLLLLAERGKVLSGIDFDSALTDTDAVVATCTFSYTHYEINVLTNP